MAWKSRNEMWNRLFGSGALSRDPTGQTSRQLRKVDNWCFLNCVWLMGERKPHTKKHQFEHSAKTYRYKQSVLVLTAREIIRWRKMGGCHAGSGCLASSASHQGPSSSARARNCWISFWP